jgi:cyclic beta-1,2-glucan glucanotransferase
MATSHQSSFDLGFVLPLTEKKSPEAPREDTNRTDHMQLPEALSSALEEMLQYTSLKRNANSEKTLDTYWQNIAERINHAATELQQPSTSKTVVGDTARLISENLSMMRLALLESRAGLQNAEKLPYAQRTDAQDSVPRSFALASVYLRAAGYYFNTQGFARYIQAVQERMPLQAAEIWNLKPFLELMLLEQAASQIAQLGNNPCAGTSPSSSGTCGASLACSINSLQRVTTLEWKTFFESVCMVEVILRSDPAGVYEKMDCETREAYRTAVAELSKRSQTSEADVAAKAVELARNAPAVQSDPRVQERRRHVGYYLVSSGKAALAQEIGYAGSLGERARNFVLQWSDVFYLLAIEVITFGVMALVIRNVHVTGLGMLPIVLLVLPAVECAVAAVNLLATRIFPPKRLPKLDFAKGIRSDCATVVAVPTLLSSEEQVRSAVKALEVRFLANRDAHLQFALVTDLPDAPQQFDEKDRLVGLCSELIRKLNEKYAGEEKGSFFHFHRDRVFNAHEGVWMGWERKRGKLIELNRFLRKESDSFPVKTGDLSLLENIRYVITLDLDTQLPPGVGHRLVGTLAHPLNRAIINPRSNAVVEGYGILQPRVDIDLKSTNRSRFAKLLSGDTGVDIYTRAVSDVYQDLFGAGIFTGKGIYEVATFEKVLDRRFPDNAVLSHDLIEGEYVRTGLASDIEVVDDYPSHYRAFSRRKHRWIRGDWQIIFGLSSRIANASGRLLPNPLNHMSRWKIIDNLRRSLTECATLVVLLYGWLVLPASALRWTLAAVAILLFPSYFPILVATLTGGKAWFRADFWRSLWADFVLATCRVFVRIAFLCHQSLIDVDAVVRSLVRMKITHKRLLQWETAADAELVRGHNGLVDSYLKYSVLFIVAMGLLIFFLNPHSLAIAAPFLFLWATAFWTGEWLNRAPRRRGVLKGEDREMVRNASLRTWRFFREFSNPQENWLIPDIVQEEPPLVAHRVSPTNLGLLLNSRLAAHDLGFLTAAEFVQDTEATLSTVKRMPHSQGHLYNWYENSTLEPVAPLFVSTVDNGNLLCSLWTLKQGCLEILKQPILRPAIWEGIRDHLDLLIEVATKNEVDSKFLSVVCDVKVRANELLLGEVHQLDDLRCLAGEVMLLRDAVSRSEVAEEVVWWTKELSLRVAAVLTACDNLTPWLDTHYQQAVSLSESDVANLAAEATLDSIPWRYRDLCNKIDAACAASGDPQRNTPAQILKASLQKSIGYAERIASRLNELARTAEAMADEMDFSLLYDSKKKLFSIGFEDGQSGISKYHYDLLASEARTAVFVAIAKGEVPQETWFQLKRSYRSYLNEDVLLSWSGTMFEYLMPCLWMKGYPTTLLQHGVNAAIRAQQKFAKENDVSCWGISESSCNQRNPDGHYRYHAFGVPPLALHTDDCSGDLVIAPYATFLALPFDTARSVKNFRKMKLAGWMSAYGFYEAADFTPRRVSDGQDHELVCNWMAHHQGMCMLAAANVLCDGSMQRRFHAEPRVAANERLLHEKLPRAVPYEQETAAMSKSAPALLRLGRKPHPGFRGFLPKLLLRGEH